MSRCPGLETSCLDRLPLPRCILLIRIRASAELWVHHLKTWVRWQWSKRLLTILSRFPWLHRQTLDSMQAISIARRRQEIAVQRVDSLLRITVASMARTSRDPHNQRRYLECLKMTSQWACSTPPLTSLQERKMPPINKQDTISKGLSQQSVTAQRASWKFRRARVVVVGSSSRRNLIGGRWAVLSIDPRKMLCFKAKSLKNRRWFSRTSTTMTPPCSSPTSTSISKLCRTIYLELPLVARSFLKKKLGERSAPYSGVLGSKEAERRHQ
jgi:hypothetical protein